MRTRTNKSFLNNNNNQRNFFLKISFLSIFQSHYLSRAVYHMITACHVRAMCVQHTGYESSNRLYHNVTPLLTYFLKAIKYFDPVF